MVAAGADKVSLNSAAVRDPSLISRVGRATAADVVAGHVQIKAVVAEDGLVELLAQLLAVFHGLGF